ncbi:MAG: M20 family metallopeptidase [Chloroflexota bacterium]
MDDLRARVSGEVDKRRDGLIELSLKLHANPELAFAEIQAAGWLTRYLEEAGFSVERGICELATAFRASYGEGQPAVAILAEYDALPEVGHGCGHNIIAAAAVGAGVAAKAAASRFGGTVMVIGTPAEELYGGKIIMAERGAFADVDMAMMVHPGARNVATWQALACQTLDVEFFGRASHAAARPEAGINALEAMIQSFTAINSLRQHIRNKARIHGIITAGGEAANIVPAYSAGSFIVRAEDDSYLDGLKERVLNCFVAASVATGARLEYRWGEVHYAPLRNNLTLARLFVKNMESLGRTMPLYDEGDAFGSTDMGNVSQLVPSIHAEVAIAPPTVLIHSPDFTQAAASEAAMDGLIAGAKALALTAADLLASPEIVVEVKKEFSGENG